jgi:uncharacterized membrane protein
MQVVDVRPMVGVSWIREAFAMFRAQPLPWISLTSAWALLSLVIALVPGIGTSFMTMAQPAFFAGFVLACRDQEMGKPVLLAHLFAGFKASGRTLLQVGGVMLLANVLVMLVLNALGFFDGLAAIDRDNANLEAIANAFRGKGLMWALAAASLALVTGVLWFTAALLAHQPMPASHAVRWSFFAFISNVIPMVFFGIFMMTLMFLAFLPWGMGLLVFVPLYAISHYTSFKSVFRADAETAATQAPDTPL